MTLVTSAAVERRFPTSSARSELGLAPPHPARAARQAAQRRAAQHRGRRHQRQIDRHRHDRLDPPRLPPPADGDERRGDEEFRHARQRPSPARWSAIRELFVSEVDESDGSIALYRPEVAVLNNVSLDHKAMDELRRLFADFPPCRAQGRAQPRRRRDPRPRRRGAGRQADQLRLSTRPGADFMGKDLQLVAEASRSRSTLKASGMQVRLAVPGRHNAANALAALAAAAGAAAARSRTRSRRSPASPASGAGSRRSAKRRASP